ncbi:alkanesulfonate monooxygenase SsuD/methylene tetrahydromethanopterin reductase-like flavin-dependent oxidoreductase (luciferase family) [Arthrobacter globiformis]|nr:alkanesulfonate monooxygenase SsuD/methylene tetrahydromethanopterin reductase-like flavin-dependent oxidoreductase (luciferase family) [Arthrobacter globiformis]
MQITELGGPLGFGSAWLRHRHLQFEISSPIALMAASQRSSRIELATAADPAGLGKPPPICWPGTNQSEAQRAGPNLPVP